MLLITVTFGLDWYFLCKSFHLLASYIHILARIDILFQLLTKLYESLVLSCCVLPSSHASSIFWPFSYLVAFQASVFLGGDQWGIRVLSASPLSHPTWNRSQCIGIVPIRIFSMWSLRTCFPRFCSRSGINLTWSLSMFTLSLAWACLGWDSHQGGSSGLVCVPLPQIRPTAFSSFAVWSDILGWAA